MQMVQSESIRAFGSAICIFSYIYRYEAKSVPKSIGKDLTVVSVHSSAFLQDSIF